MSTDFADEFKDRPRPVQFQMETRSCTSESSPTPDILSVAAQELQGTRLYHYNTAVLVSVPLNNNPCCSGRQLKLWLGAGFYYELDWE